MTDGRVLHTQAGEEDGEIPAVYDEGESWIMGRLYYHYIRKEVSDR